MRKAELHAFLDAKVEQYQQPAFIADDPIQIPHEFTAKEDIEIAGFLTATIAWGNRKAIIKSAKRMMRLLDNAPYDFVMHHQEKDLQSLNDFVHRTFNGTDFIQFIRSLNHIYKNDQGLEGVFRRHATPKSLQTAIHELKNVFFSIPHPKRTTKHLSDPLNQSAAKRINMFLRWMVRTQGGVDFGLWTSLKPAQLSCPLDVHSGNVARKLGLLSRKQNDAKAVAELDRALRTMDPLDPVKYDFALFGLGVFEKF